MKSMYIKGTKQHIDPPTRDSSTNGDQCTVMLFMDNHDHYTLFLCHCYLKVDTNKFDGFYSIGWVTQMENYFSLDGIKHDLQKLKIWVLYLELEGWQWWKCYQKSYHHSSLGTHL